MLETAKKGFIQNLLPQIKSSANIYKFRLKYFRQSNLIIHITFIS